MPLQGLEPQFEDNENERFQQVYTPASQVTEWKGRKCVRRINARA
jgi:hypothetical protein